MKIVAKTQLGKEFLYSRDSAHKVSERSAQHICDALNEKRWGLKEGQVWHVYDIATWEVEYCGAYHQSFVRRKGALYERF